MKLRNKKTGKIAETSSCNSANGKISIYYEEKDGRIGTCDNFSSLAELNEEWEDYEEPEEFWYVNECGDVLKYKYDGGCSCPILEAKEIGNYFETKEEAEQAVEKLKAYKRLKDKCFVFTGCGRYHWTGEEWPHIAFSYPNFDDLFYDKQTIEDLDLLFGGEE